MTPLPTKGAGAERRCRAVADDSCNHSQSWRTATTVSVHADSANHEFNTLIREKKKRVFPRKKNQWSLDPRGTIPTSILVHWKCFLFTNCHDENNHFFQIFSFFFLFILFLLFDFFFHIQSGYGVILSVIFSIVLWSMADHRNGLSVMS